MTRAVDKSFLHVARERRGLHQDDVAKKFDVTQATVSNWETGKSAPHPSKWDDLAETYGVSVTALFKHFREAAA